jgi:polyisoprenoid-binding protein YceI
MKCLMPISAALALTVTLLAEPVAIDLRSSASSRMELSVEKTGLLAGKKHLFTFGSYAGRLQFDREAPTSSTVEFDIESSSILCQDSWLSAKDLRKVQQYAVTEMLAAASHPLIQFRSTGVRKLDPDRYAVDGILTLRNLSRQALVTVAVDQGSGAQLSFEGTVKIRLTDFGLKPPTAAFGTIGTKDEIVLRFVLPASTGAGLGASR